MGLLALSAALFMERPVARHPRIYTDPARPLDANEVSDRGIMAGDPSSAANSRSNVTTWRHRAPCATALAAYAIQGRHRLAPSPLSGRAIKRPRSCQPPVK